jgi:hypothetical protein
MAMGSHADGCTGNIHAASSCPIRERDKHPEVRCDFIDFGCALRAADKMLR